MKVTFYLGPTGSHLEARKLRITRITRAGDDSRPYRAFTNNDIANTVENITVDLPINQIYVAELTDTNVAGVRSRVDTLHFHTGTLQFPGPKSADRLSVLEMTYESSSSLSSQSTSSSSTSSQSESSQSDVSSQSTSSSSQSTSSSSQSTSSSSESSSQSTSSSSQSTSSSSQSTSSSSLSESSASSQSSSSS